MIQRNTTPLAYFSAVKLRVAIHININEPDKVHKLKYVWVTTKLALDLAEAYFGFVSNSIKVIESIMVHEGSQSSMLLFLKLKSQ